MKYNSKKIAFFDSGVGGLTVLEKFRKILPNEDCIYFGDLLNSPYGAKTKPELITIADNVFKFLETKDVKAVVMACNTTSANTYDELKNNYSFKIYPIIQSAMKVLSSQNVQKWGVLATEATVKSGAYSKFLKQNSPNVEVFEMSCPPWVEIVESGETGKKQNIDIVQKYLDKMLKNKPQKIILGCTHYPFLLDILSKFAPADMFIDPARSFVEYIKSDLNSANLLNPKTTIGKDEFYVSAHAEAFQKASQKFYRVKELPKIIGL